MVAEIYGRVRVLIDGKAQLEITNAHIELDSVLVPVDTIEKGLAGFTEGSGKTTITGGTALPIGGFEFNFMSAIANKEAHDVQIDIGPHSYRSTGVFQNGAVGMGVNASAEGNWTWMGDLKSLE